MTSLFYLKKTNGISSTHLLLQRKTKSYQTSNPVDNRSNIQEYVCTFSFIPLIILKCVVSKTIEFLRQWNIIAYAQPQRVCLCSTPKGLWTRFNYYTNRFLIVTNIIYSLINYQIMQVETYIWPEI